MVLERWLREALVELNLGPHAMTLHDSFPQADPAKWLQQTPYSLLLRRCSVPTSAAPPTQPSAASSQALRSEMPNLSFLTSQPG